MYGFKSLNPPVSDSGGPLVSDSGGPLVSDSGGPLVSTFFVRHFMKGFTGQKKKKEKWMLMPQPGPLHVTLPSFLGIVLPPSPSGAYFDDTNLPAPRSRWGNFGAYFIIKIRYLCREGTIDICSIIFNIINR